jgi:hypothetical protein
MKIYSYRLEKEKGINLDKIEDLKFRTICSKAEETGKTEHLFLIIHPGGDEDIKSCIRKLCDINYTILIVSTTPKDFEKFSSNNIHVLSYGVETLGTGEKQKQEIIKRFNCFYEDVKNITSDHNEKILESIEKYLEQDSLSKEDEQDIAFIKLHQSLNSDKDWKELEHFQKYDGEKKQRLEKILKKHAKNLWQNKREVLNHTYIGHYLKDLVTRKKFQKIYNDGNFKSKEIKEVIKNSKNIEKQIEELMDWAVPFAMITDETNYLSHFKDKDLENELKEVFERKKEELTKKYKSKIKPMVDNTLEKTKKLMKLIKKLEDEKKEDDLIQELIKSIDELSCSISSFKTIIE